MLLKPRYQIVIVSLCLAIIATLSLVTGNTLVSPGTVVQALFNFDNENDLHDVVTSARASGTIIALLTNATLAVSSLLIQALARNPIASPGLFDVNAGTIFFVIFSITLIQIQFFKMVVVIAFLGAIVVAILVAAPGMFRQTLFSPHRVISAGAAVAMLLTVFTQGILIMNEADLQGLLFWLSDSVSLRNIWDIPWIVPFVLILILITFSMAAHINISMTSDDVATGLGRDIRSIKWMVIMLVSMLAGISIAVVGSIVFVGLIVPNIDKQLLPSSYKYLIPFTALTGAVLMIVSDIAACIIVKLLESPISVVTAAIDTIVLIYLVKKGCQRL